MMDRGARPSDVILPELISDGCFSYTTKASMAS